MINGIYLENFRNITNEGTFVKLTPITVLTGCNSSGKSSLAKGLLLLETYLSDVRRNNNDLFNTPLDFSKIVKLGTYDSVLNNTSKSFGENTIVLGYSIESDYLASDIHIDFIFESVEQDLMNNGWLKELTVSIGEHNILSLKKLNGEKSLTILNHIKFYHYYQAYMIKQISAAYKEAREDLRYEQTGESVMVKEDERLDFPIDAQISSSLFELIESQEQHLIKNNILSKKILLTHQLDPHLKKLNLRDLLYALSGSIEIDPIDIPIYRHKYLSEELSEWDYENMINEMSSILSEVSELFPESYLDDKKKLDQYRKDVEAYAETGDIRQFVINRNNQIIDGITGSWIHFNKILNPSGIEVEHTTPTDIFLSNLFKIILDPEIIGMIGYVEAATVEIKRLYPLDASDKFGNLWKSYDDLLRKGDKVGDFMRKWLQEFEICDDFKIDTIEGGLQVKLISSEAPKGRLLADYGYGVTQLVSLLLNIEIATQKVEKIFSGVPGVYEAEVIYQIPYRLLIEEPEVHLHPSLQSRLADMFQDAAKRGVNFTIETHSEYMIRRMQVNTAFGYSTSKNFKCPFKIYYVPLDGRPYDMGLRGNGKFSESFGSGFFDVADNSAMDLFGYDE